MRRLIRSVFRARRSSRSGRRTAVAVVVAAVIAGSLGNIAPPARAQSMSRIVAGQSIGLARLGMTESQLADVLGPSTAQSATRRVYPRYGVVVEFRHGLAVRISTSTSTYRTVAGAGVGSNVRETSRLIGDINAVTTVSGQSTTVWYEFQGIGFVFRGGRAVEAFVMEAVPLGDSPAAGTPGNPQAPPSASQSPSAGAVPAGPGAMFRDLKATVERGGGLIVTGTVVNTGSAQPGPLTVAGLFLRASGAQIESKAQIDGPLAPGASASFSLQVLMVQDIILRYQVNVANPAGAILAASGLEAVPPAAYADFARKQIHIKVELAAPNTGLGPPQVQAVVTVTDTGAIPPAWVQQVSVQVPFSAEGSPGIRNAQLRPGQQQTVLVPAGASLGSPFITGVVLSGG